MILVLCPPGPAQDQLLRAAPKAVAYRETVAAAPFHAGTWFEVDDDAQALRDRLRRFGGWLSGVGNSEAGCFQVCKIPEGIGIIDWIEEQVAKEEGAFRKPSPSWRAPSPGEEGSPVQDDPESGQWDGKPLPKV